MRPPAKGLNAFKGIRFSSHARRRVRQRGVRMTDLNLVLEEGDRETRVGSNCVSCAISRARRLQLLAEGHPPGVVDRVAKLAVIESSDGMIVTVLRPNGNRGRRYRTPFGARRSTSNRRRSRTR
jgi:hypothetical protein